MSRIGNQQIEFKDDVQVSIVNNIINVTGPKC